MMATGLTRHLGSFLRHCPRVVGAVSQVRHHGSHYPIDDEVYGLTEEQQQVTHTHTHQLLGGRRTVNIQTPNSHL